MTRIVRVMLSSTMLVAAGCGSNAGTLRGVDDEPDSGAGGVGASAQAPVRSACGDLPILDDKWKGTSDDCKACVDAECCGEAEACAGNPDCATLWECRAQCDRLLSSCVEACNAALTSLPPENAAFVGCRGRCKPCLDVTSCRQGLPPAPAEPSYPMVVTCVSYSSSQVVFAGITVKVCDAADIECERPLAQGTTDQKGVVTLDVPASPWFTEAYFEYTGSNVQPTRSFARYGHAQDVFDRGTLTQRLLDSATASAFAGILGAKSDPATTGLVNVVAVSCGNLGLAGMTIESSGADSSTIVGYVDGVAPSPTAVMTDPSGIGGFADHPPGPSTFTVRDALTGEVLGSVEASVRAGFMNGVVVPPSP